MDKFSISMPGILLFSQADAACRPLSQLRQRCIAVAIATDLSMTGDDLSTLLNDLWLTAANLAVLLGVDRATTYRWIKNGDRQTKVGAWQDEFLSLLVEITEDEEKKKAWEERRMEVLRAGRRGELTRAVYLVLEFVYGQGDEQEGRPKQR